MPGGYKMERRDTATDRIGALEYGGNTSVPAPWDCQDALPHALFYSTPPPGRSRRKLLKIHDSGHFCPSLKADPTRIDLQRLMSTDAGTEGAND